MTIQNTTERMIQSFNRGIFPEPHDFTDTEIEAIGLIPGIDQKGTFANTAMEESLMHRYGVEAYRGEITWPEFAEMLHDVKSEHFKRLTREKRFALQVNQLREAIANYDRLQSLTNGSANR